MLEIDGVLRTFVASTPNAVPVPDMLHQSMPAVTSMADPPGCAPTALPRRLGPDVKLAGSTISCEGAAYGGDSSGHWRQTPHVQSFALALDSQALRLLLEDRRVLQCYDNR